MYEIVGVQDKSFAFEGKDGKPVKVNGYQVHCTDDSNDKVQGVSVLSFFMSNRSNYNPKVGDCLDAICYNRYGKLDRVLPSGKF